MNRFTVLIIVCALLCGGLFAQTDKQKLAESPPRSISISQASANRLTEMQAQIDRQKAEADAAIARYATLKAQQESFARMELLTIYKNGLAKSNEDCSISFDDKTGWQCLCKPESPGQLKPKQE